MLTEIIFQHPVLYGIQMKYLQEDQLSSKEEISDLIKKYTRHELSQSTLFRRSRTIISWIKYINEVYRKIGF